MGSHGGCFQGGLSGHPVQVVPGLAGANCLNARQRHASVLWGWALRKSAGKGGWDDMVASGYLLRFSGKALRRGMGFYEVPYRPGRIPSPSRPGRF